MSRALPEWCGKTADTPVPPRVRLRLFDAYGGVCQCGCTRKIQAGEAWDLDHYVPLISGGGHRENNLRPMLKAHHAEKTKSDVAMKAKTYKSRKRNLGMHKAKRPFRGWQKFSGEAVINPKAVRR